MSKAGKHNGNDNADDDDDDDDDKDIDISTYKVGVVVAMEELNPGTSNNNNKALRWCHIDIGDEENGPIPVVTSAPNVRLESRVVVALAGSKVRCSSSSSSNTTTETTTTTMIVKPTTIGGKLSRGILCDSKMLGWTGGAAGVAVNLPNNDNNNNVEYAIGSAPPKTKPRFQGDRGNNNDHDNNDTSASIAGPVTGGLFERKLSKFLLWPILPVGWIVHYFVYVLTT
jgi:tRNA-binding EMAP/Myf-like protein